MTFGMKLIKSIYFEEPDNSLKEIKKFLDKPKKYTVRSNIDFINEPDFIFSTEKIILYKYFSLYNREPAFKFYPENVFLFNLLNIHYSNIDYIYPICY